MGSAPQAAGNDLYRVARLAQLGGPQPRNTGAVEIALSAVGDSHWISSWPRVGLPQANSPTATRPSVSPCWMRSATWSSPSTRIDLIKGHVRLGGDW